MLYTNPSEVFDIIKSRVNYPVTIYYDGDIEVTAVNDGCDVCITAEDATGDGCELNCAAEQSDVELCVESVYAKMNIENPAGSDDKNEYIDEDEMELIVEDSEEHLNGLVLDFILEICPDLHWAAVDEEVVETVKNAVLGILGWEFDFDVERPTIIENEDGSKRLVNNPYQVLESPSK